MRAVKILLICLAMTITATRCGRTQKPPKPLKEVVTDLNEKCPAMVDAETRIDRLESIGDSVLRYHYTLISLSAPAVDTAEFFRAMWPGILSYIRVSREMKVLRDQEIIIEYAYWDRDQKPIYTFRIRPEDYHQAP
jgi:hypothetical protein